MTVLSEIRRATTLDAAGIARVHVASWRETYASLLPHAMLAALDVDARERMWASLLAASDPVVALVLERNGQIQGFAAFGEQRSPELGAAGYDAEISAIYILAAAQRFGSGRKLIRGSASSLSGSGSKGVSLWVLADNRNARSFYERLGGQIVGEREEYFAQTLLKEVAYGWPDLWVLENLDEQRLRP